MNEPQNNSNGERGQTSAEYVAVTAVAVSLALGLGYLVLESSLASAVADIGAAIANFIASEMP